MKRLYFTSVSESQPHENDIANIHHEHYKCGIIVPPHSLGSPSMYKPEESDLDYEKVKHGHRYFARLTKCKSEEYEGIEITHSPMRGGYAWVDTRKTGV